jgi:hypothetical protein
MTNTRLPAPQRGFPPDIGSQWRTVSAGPCIVSSYFKGYRSRHFSVNYDKSDLVGDFMAVLDNLFNNYLRALCVRIPEERGFSSAAERRSSPSADNHCDLN